MNETNGFLMDPGCPWVHLRIASGLPNVHWCEEQICSWITNPADAWSNLGYIGVGVWLMLAYRREKSANLRFYGPGAQAVGWTSFLYHASLTFATQILDFIGMFVFFYLILVQNFARCGWIRPDRVKRWVWGLTAATTAVSAFVDRWGFPIQGLIMLLITFILATEVASTLSASRKFSYRYMVISLASLGTGAGFSASDVTRKFCDPTNHWLQGHAIWHLFGAAALYFSYHYYRQFYDPSNGEMRV